MRLMGYCHPQDVAAFRKALDEKGMGSVPIQEEPALDRGHWYVVDFDEVVRMTKRVYSTGTIRPYTLAEREGE